MTEVTKRTIAAVNSRSREPRSPIGHHDRLLDEHDGGDAEGATHDRTQGQECDTRLFENLEPQQHHVARLVGCEDSVSQVVISIEHAADAREN